MGSSLDSKTHPPFNTHETLLSRFCVILLTTNNPADQTTHQPAPQPTKQTSHPPTNRPSNQSDDEMCVSLWSWKSSNIAFKKLIVWWWKAVLTGCIRMCCCCFFVYTWPRDLFLFCLPRREIMTRPRPFCDFNLLCQVTCIPSCLRCLFKDVTLGRICWRGSFFCKSRVRLWQVEGLLEDELPQSPEDKFDDVRLCNSWCPESDATEGRWCPRQLASTGAHPSVSCRHSLWK